MYDIVEFHYLKNTLESYETAIRYFKICEDWCEKWTKVKNERARLLRRQAESLTPVSDMDGEIQKKELELKRGQ